MTIGKEEEVMSNKDDYLCATKSITKDPDQPCAYAVALKSSCRVQGQQRGSSHAFTGLSCSTSFLLPKACLSSITQFLSVYLTS